jgi:positive regulator of sigma E activity
MLMTPSVDQKRNYVKRAERWECSTDLVVADDCGRELLARIANISDKGFMAETEEKVRKGSIVEVTLPDQGRVRAEVRWVQGWRFGAMILSKVA